MDDFEDIVVVAFTDVVALLVVVVVVVENWFCPFGVEKTTLKTLLEAAEKAVFFIVVVFKASLLKEEEEEEDKEVDEIAWFMFASCVSLFCLLAEKKKKILCGCRKKKKGERDFYAKTLSSKKVSKGRAFFFSLESENKSLLRRAARWCDDENDE